MSHLVFPVLFLSEPTGERIQEKQEKQEKEEYRLSCCTRLSDLIFIGSILFSEGSFSY